MKAIILGLILGIASLAAAPYIHINPSVVPLCPPDQPNCGLNQ